MRTQAGHIRIPDTIAARTDLTWTQKAILGLIGRIQQYPENNGSCSMTYETIAAMLGITRWQAIREIKGRPGRGYPGIPEADLLVLRAARPKGAARTPVNHYSATWAVKLAQRRKYAEAKTLQFPPPGIAVIPGGL